jgi:hypothetical protein
MGCVTIKFLVDLPRTYYYSKIFILHELSVTMPAMKAIGVCATTYKTVCGWVILKFIIC